MRNTYLNRGCNKDINKIQNKRLNKISMVISNFGKDYLLSGLRIHKIIDGFVDAYFGPKEFQSIVKNEKQKSPRDLLDSCRKLQKELKSQGFSVKRKRFLEKILVAIETSLEIKNGKILPYLEQVNKIYDIKPKLIDDSIFLKAIDELNSLYKGPGNLLERIIASRKQKEIPYDKVKQSYSKAFNILRKQTKKLFPKLLPLKEEININIVKDQPWNAYNWYLGDKKSRIDINTDLPILWTNILSTAAHEGYPGHHTHNAVREELLYNNQNQFEHSILLIPTPEAVISEGIGNTGLDVLLSQEEIAQITLDQLCPNPLDEDVERIRALRSAWKKNSGFSGNLAIFAHVDGWSDEQLGKVWIRFRIFTRKTITATAKIYS